MLSRKGMTDYQEVHLAPFANHFRDFCVPNPCDLRGVDESHASPKIYENAEVEDIRDHPFTDITLPKLLPCRPNHYAFLTI